MPDSLISPSPSTPAVNTTQLAITERGSLVYGAGKILNRVLVNLGLLNDSDTELMNAIRCGDKNLIRYILKEDYFIQPTLSQSQMTRLREAFRLAVKLRDSETVKWLFKCGFILNSTDCKFAKKIPDAAILTYVFREQNRPLELILDKELLASMGVTEFKKLIKKVAHLENESYDITHYRRKERIFLFALTADIAEDQKPKFLQEILDVIGPRNGRFLYSLDYPLWKNEQIAEVLLRNIHIDEAETHQEALRLVLNSARNYYNEHPPKSNIMTLVDTTINFLDERTCATDTPPTGYLLGFLEGRFRRLNASPQTIAEQQMQVDMGNEDATDSDSMRP